MSVVSFRTFYLTKTGLKFRIKTNIAYINRRLNDLQCLFPNHNPIRMNLFLKRSIFLFILTITAISVKASHLFGADFYYAHVSGNTYNLVLDVYGDCSGSSFPNLPGSIPLVEIFENNTLYQTLSLALTGPPIEVTPVCPAQLNNTTCTNASNPVPGVKKFHYTGSVTLNGPSANWLFRFTGEMQNTSLAGRSNSMTNIIFSGPGGGSVMVLEATLNNTSAPNSSVNYTTIPTPFFCLNIATQFNPGAVDPNNDNLTFSLVSGIEQTGLVTYLPPYSATQPLAAAPGTFAFSTVTGQLGFTPNLLQKSLVVYKVNEYRNGVLVGTSMREMTFVVLNTCNNIAPVTSAIGNLSTGTLLSPYHIKACSGNTNLTFNFTASDGNNDNVTITYVGLPSGATATIANNNTTSPQFNFSWNISAVPSGTYTFYVTLKDDGCPLASTQTFAYSITVVPFGDLPNIGAISGCINSNNSVAWVHPQLAGNYSFTWKDANNQVVHQANSSNGDTVYTLSSGIYNVHLVNSSGCDTDVVVTVPSVFYEVKFTGDTVACINAQASFQNNSTSNMTIWNWTFGDGGSSTVKNPSHTFTAPGIYTVILIGKSINGCSDSFSTQINVHEVILTVSPTQTICENQATIIQASGAIKYNWTPVTGLSCPICYQTTARPLVTTTYTVTGTDMAGCKGTAQVLVNVLPTGLEVSPNDTGICPGDSLQLHVTGASNFRWIPTTGLSDTGANPWVHPTGWLNYMVVAVYPNGCHDTEMIKIAFYPHGVIYLPDSVTIYPGESYQLDPAGNCLYFTWWPSLGLSNDHISNPIARPPVNTRYYVLGKTEGGCSAIDSIDIYVAFESLIDIANAFSPGGGVNNSIHVIRRGEATLKTFRIYNRWGAKVFESSNIDEGWDGTLHGIPQPMGVYVYIVEAYTNTGRRFYKQGNITLIR
jgi:gliding motility-associated-like protein